MSGGAWMPSDAVLEAEAAVLGAAIQSKAAAEMAAEKLTPRSFYMSLHVAVFEAVTAMLNDAIPIDAQSVLRMMHRDGQMVDGQKLFALVQRAAVGNLPSHVEAVARDATRREMLNLAAFITEVAGPSFDPDIHLDKVRERLDAISNTVTGDDPPTAAELLYEVLEDLEREDERKELVQPPYRDMERLVPAFEPGELILIGARPSVGKALALDTPIPTPSGWTTMGEVSVGDEVLGADGTHATVTAATEVMHDRVCYEVTFSDGSTIVADADHQWYTTTRPSRKSAYSRALPRKGGSLARDQSSRHIDPSVKTTKEIAATLRCIDGRLNHAIPNAKAVQLPDQEFLLPPYVLGAWLGDGTSAGSGFTCADPELLDHIRAQGIGVNRVRSTKYGYRLVLPIHDPREKINCLVCGRTFCPQQAGVRTCGKSCGGKVKVFSAPVPLPGCPRCGAAYSGKMLCQACRRSFGSVAAVLRTVGVLGNKHIPAEYLRGSEAQRRDLLAGLLDTDGYIDKCGTVQFAVTSKRLAYGAWELILSLGYRATMRTKPVQGRSPASSICYMVTFSPADTVFRLSRKANRQKKVRGARTQARMITDVREIPSVPVRCIQVDSADHLFLAGRTWIPTHNSTVAMDFARYSALHLKKRVLFASLEMTGKNCMQRLVSAEATIDLMKIKSKSVTDDDWNRIAKIKSSIEESELIIDAFPGYTLGRLRAHLRREERRGGCQLVIVDYLQLMKMPASDSREQAVAATSRGLKLLALEFQIPIVLLAQLNRGPEHRTDKTPVMSDFRESGALEQDADIGLLLFRADVNDQESSRAGELDLIVAKNRNGPCGTVTVAFQGHYSRAMDLARPEWSPTGGSQ